MKSNLARNPSIISLNASANSIIPFYYYSKGADIALLMLILKDCYTFDFVGSWIVYKTFNNKMFELVAYELMSANDAPERDPMNWYMDFQTFSDKMFYSWFFLLSSSIDNKSCVCEFHDLSWHMLCSQDS